MGFRHLILVLVAATGCAAGRSSESTFARYTCDGKPVARNGDEVAFGGARVSRLASTGDADRFIGTVGDRQVELVLPRDTRVDGWVSEGATRRACVVHGGYSDALARWMRGETADEIATQLALADRAAARQLIHDAILNLHVRYRRER